MRLVSVAVPVPFLEPLTYIVPGHLTMPVVGARVLVPVGPRTLTGCVVEHVADAPATDGLKDVVEVLDSEPYLPASIVALCGWVAEYYLSGVGDALAAAMPPGSRRAERGTRRSAAKTRRVAAITAHGASCIGVAAGAAAAVMSTVPALSEVEGPALSDIEGPEGLVDDHRPLTGRQRIAL
jgi:primosomal protein N'